MKQKLYLTRAAGETRSWDGSVSFPSGCCRLWLVGRGSDDTPSVGAFLTYLARFGTLVAGMTRKVSEETRVWSLFTHRSVRRGPGQTTYKLLGRLLFRDQTVMEQWKKSLLFFVPFAMCTTVSHAPSLQGAHAAQHQVLASTSVPCFCLSGCQGIVSLLPAFLHRLVKLSSPEHSSHHHPPSRG